MQGNEFYKHFIEPGLFLVSTKEWILAHALRFLAKYLDNLLTPDPQKLWYNKIYWVVLSHPVWAVCHTTIENQQRTKK